MIWQFLAILLVIAAQGNDTFLKLKCRRLSHSRRHSGPCRRFLHLNDAPETKPRKVIVPPYSGAQVAFISRHNDTINATTGGPSPGLIPTPSEEELHLEKWLPPFLLTLLGSYASGVFYLWFKMNMGNRHSFSLGLTFFCVRRNFVPHSSSVLILVERLPMSQIEEQTGS